MSGPKIDRSKRVLKDSIQINNALQCRGGLTMALQKTIKLIEEAVTKLSKNNLNARLYPPRNGK